MAQAWVDGTRVTEPVFIPDIVVTELISVEHLGGGMYRFTFINKYRDLVTFEEVSVVQARLVLSAASVFRAAVWALKAIGARCCGNFLMDRCSLH